MKSKLLTIHAKTKVRVVCSLMAIAVTLALAMPAFAQLDPGLHDIFQVDEFGDKVKVGEIYVPTRERGATNYTEHWVLFDNYVYPSAANPVVTIIKASQRKATTEEDFFAGIPDRPGIRYVRVECTDTAVLPGR